jgi:hypothetical protein
LQNSRTPIWILRAFSKEEKTPNPSLVASLSSRRRASQKYKIKKIKRKQIKICSACVLFWRLSGHMLFEQKYFLKSIECICKNSTIHFLSKNLFLEYFLGKK